MKKLIMAMAAIALATASQAATFDWRTGAMKGAIYTAGSTTTTYNGTAYLFDAAVYAQADMFASLQSGAKTVGDFTSLASKTVTSGKIATGTTFNWGNAGDTLSAYFVVAGDESFYMSVLASGAADASSTTTLSFAAQATSQAALSDADTFGGAGWYAVGSSTPTPPTPAVPEPTSGVLMLVGMGVLALRRKRA